jgi:hypothetical protein
MTKRKRTPPPSPPPSHQRVDFEVPQSLLKFQAIARELARQSEEIVQRAADQQDTQLRDFLQPAPGAPLFDAQTFQNKALRFSPYSHQPFLPSQPWPQAGKPQTAPTGRDTNTIWSTVPNAPPSELAPDTSNNRRRSEAGPDDQLFDELNNALNSPDTDNLHAQASQPQHIGGGNRISFDPHPTNSWSTLQPKPYQPPISTRAHRQARPFIESQSPYPEDVQHIAPHANFLPTSPTQAPQPSFYNQSVKPPPAQYSNYSQRKANIPGYYKSSLKLWSQEEPTSPPTNSVDLYGSGNSPTFQPGVYNAANDQPQFAQSPTAGTFAGYGGPGRYER